MGDGTLKMAAVTACSRRHGTAAGLLTPIRDPAELAVRRYGKRRLKETAYLAHLFHFSPLHLSAAGGHLPAGSR